MSLKTTIKQLLPNSWILKRQCMESCHPVEKRRTHGSQTFRKGLCGSRIRLSNAICLRGFR